MFSKITAALAYSALALFAASCSGEAAKGAQLKETTVAEAADIKASAVLIYADWCGSCKILDPKLRAAQQQNEFENVRFVVLDYTDRDEEAFYTAAAEAGVGDAVRTYLDGTIKTGLLLLVDADDNKVVTKVTKTFSEAEIVDAINAAVAQS